MPSCLALKATSSLLVSWCFLCLLSNFNFQIVEVVGFVPLTTTQSISRNSHHFYRTIIRKYADEIVLRAAVSNDPKNNDIFDGNIRNQRKRVETDGGNCDEEKVDGIFLQGKHKYLGGAMDPVDGRIYGIPSHASDVICLSPPEVVSSADGDVEEDSNFGEYIMNKIPLPHSIAMGKNKKFKWLRGIIWNGFLYGIPAWSNEGVLRVDIDQYWGRRRQDKIDDIVTVLPFPQGALGGNHSSSLGNNDDSNTNNMDGEYPTRWLWHGAAMNKNETAMYAIPSNAHHILKIDLQMQKTSLLPIPVTVTPLTQTNKWYGAILGDDNAIYGVPYAASGLLRIDANTDTVELIGEDEFGLRKYNWHGGVKAGNGKIYCFPAHNSHVLSVDTTASASMNDNRDRLSLLPIHRAPYDDDKVTRYKWLGGSLGRDGNVYGMPSDASSILRIDVEDDTVTTFGKVSEEKNKYQGGTLARDGVVYAIPSNANDILCIDTNMRNDKKSHSSDKLTSEKYISSLDRDAAFVIGSLESTKDKWQGGFVGKDGAIYCIPENFHRIMKVAPQGKCSMISFL